MTKSLIPTPDALLVMGSINPERRGKIAALDFGGDAMHHAIAQRVVILWKADN